MSIVRYLDTVSTTADQTGWILGNLKIAEDRVLSYAAVLKTREETFMKFVTNSIFYFESERNTSFLSLFVCLLLLLLYCA
jgi:hypothetical protein